MKTNKFLLVVLVVCSTLNFFLKSENFWYSVSYSILIILPYEIFGRSNLRTRDLVLGYSLGGMIGFIFPRSLQGCIILTLFLGFLFNGLILFFKESHKNYKNI